MERRPRKNAKRRIEFIEGNVNSYARILNGPQQLARIKTFNDLAASISVLQREKDTADQKSKEERKQQDEQRAANRLEKDRKAKEEIEMFGPGCKEDVQKGIAFVLSLTNPRRKLILKIHFGKTGILGYNLANTERLLRECMGVADADALQAIAQDALIGNTATDTALPVLGQEEGV